MTNLERRATPTPANVMSQMGSKEVKVRATKIVAEIDTNLRSAVGISISLKRGLSNFRGTSKVLREDLEHLR